MLFKKHIPGLFSTFLIFLSVLSFIGCQDTDEEPSAYLISSIPSATLSDSKAITAFSFNASDNAALSSNATVTIVDTDINAVVPEGIDLTALVASYTATGELVAISDTAQVSCITANDYTSPVTYTITAENGTTEDYTVTVTNSAKAITAFSFNASDNAALSSNATVTIVGTDINAVISEEIDVTALVASYTTTGESVAIGDTAQVSGITANDYSNPVTYTVTAENGTTEDYTVTVTNSAKAITAFSFDASDNAALSSNAAVTIDGTDINAEVPTGTDVSALIATFTTTGESVAIGDTIQVSGATANNFTSPVTYTVTADDGTTEDYTATVTAGTKSITAFSFEGSVNTALSSGIAATIDGNNVTVEVPSGTDVTALVSTFTVSSGVLVLVDGAEQTSGTTANDFTNAVTYRITASDNTIIDYIVTVTLASAAPITAYFNTGSYVDGDGDSGLNKDGTQSADYPNIAQVNSKVYAAWQEVSAVNGRQQAVVAVFDGTSSWSFVDGNGLYGINKDASEDAYIPRIIEFNSKLYATWAEGRLPYWNGSAVVSIPLQLRVAVYNGDDSSPSWTFVDGNGADGLNYNTGNNASIPDFGILNSKLYITWYEGSKIRVVVYNGDDSSPSWSFVDGNTADGINYDPTKGSRFSVLKTFDSKLYATWYEQRASDDVYQTRVAVYNGDDSSPSWSFVDGNGADGINFNTSKSSNRPKLAVANSKLYALWAEMNTGDIQQVRVAVYNGEDSSPSWTFVDGNADVGLNKNPAYDAWRPRLTTFRNKIYAAWYEENNPGGAPRQLRAMVYNGDDSSPEWSFIDGDDATNGFNRDVSEDAKRIRIFEAYGNFYAIWWEGSLAGASQIRVKQAEVNVDP